MIVDNRRMFRSQVNDCTRDCLECNYVCLQTISHCLRRGAPYSDPATIDLLYDCVEMTQVTANLMIRDSTMYPLLCQLCADLCRRSAQVFGELNDDEQLYHCANICFQCAESCGRVAHFVVPAPCAAATA